MWNRKMKIGLQIATGVVLALVSAEANATPILSEVFYDAVGSDNGLSFVEIYGVPGTSLDGMTLEGVNGANGSIGPIVTLSGSIPADGLFVVADVDGSDVTLVPGADLLANFDFQNGPDSIQLVDAGSILDALGYGAFAIDEIFAGEGTAALDPPAGSSLARLFANVDSDDNALDFVVLVNPTPGLADFADVPEPGSFSMLALGILSLAHARRRRGVGNF